MLGVFNRERAVIGTHVIDVFVIAHAPPLKLDHSKRGRSQANTNKSLSPGL